MDLSTLDGLLKTHITHLQDLYGQLGASKDVVPSKLQELHASLVGTVQQQRQSAEDEVKAVQDRIASLTTSIAHKRAQLSGGASTSVTSTPAVTPDKSETLLQEQERLEREEVTLERDVQMRVKQIAQIAKDVESYRTLLGSDFLESIDIHDQASWADTDLSLSKVSFLQERLAQCKAEMSRREQAFQALLQDVLDLWNELGISPTTSKDPKLQRISEEPASESPASTLDLAILHTIQWTTRTGDTTATVAVSAPPNLLKADASTLHRLSDRKAALEKEREGRMQRIQDLYDQLYPLWTRLGVSDEEADEFVETWKGCEQRCIEAYEMELSRMLRIKAENMAVFIAKEREEIVALWDALYYSEEQRACFTAMDSDLSNEELLLAHEIEKRKLLEERQNKTNILSKLTKYFALLEEMRQLEESANDPSRLTGRGQRGDPGRLLREEKQRKRVVKEKPKLEGDLLRAIPEWETQYGEPFLVSGSRLLEDLSAKVELEQAARPPSRRARTPGPSASHAPPNASDIRHTAKRVMHPPSAAGPASSQTFGATKRARVGTSARLETNTQLPASSRRHDAVGAFPATPCPQSSKPNSNRSDNLMLVASEARPAGQGTATDRLNSSSRLPLKATFPASHQALPLSWHSVGLDPSTRATFATATHLVGVGRPAAQDHHRAAFRPRPSLASVSTSCSSVPSTSLFSGRSSRIASTATTASSESFERC